MAPPPDAAAVHVLLVDDEANLLRVLKRGLELAGFAVTAVPDAAAAAEALSSASARPDVLVTDLSMPKTSGIELAREARAAHPDMPVLLCTGFVHPELEQEAREAGVTRLLDKPLQVRGLADVIREVLEG